MFCTRHLFRVLLWLVICEEYLGEERRPNKSGEEAPSSSSSSSASLPFSFARSFMFGGRFINNHIIAAQRGKEFLQMQNYNEAITYFNRAIELKSDEARYYKLRGDCLKAMGNLEEAADNYGKVVEYDPSPINRIAYSRSLYDCESYDAAMTEMIRSEDPEQMWELWNDLWSAGKFHLAVDLLTALIEIKPEASYYKTRGQCHWFMGSKSLAISDYKTVIQMEPENLETRLLLKGALLTTRNYEEANRVIIESQNEEEILKMAKEMLSQSKHSEAVLSLTELIRIAGTDSVVDYYKMRGKCNFKLQNWHAAIPDFQKVLEVEPNSLEDRLFLIKSFCAVGRFEEAVKEFLNLDNTDEMIKFIEGLYDERRFDKALIFADSAIQKNPFEPKFFKLRGICYKDSGNAQMAVHDFYQLIRLTSPNPSRRALLQKALFSYGKIDETVGAYLSVLSAADIEELGRQFSSRKKFDAAFYCFNEVLNRAFSEERLSLRANCLFDRGDVRMAVIDYANLLEMKPNSSVYPKKFKKQLVDAGRKFNQVPDETLAFVSDKMLFELGDEFRDTTQLENAIRCYTLAINKNSSKPQYFKRRGDCYKRLNNLEMALLDFQKVLELDPRDKEAQKTVGRLLFDLKKFYELIEFTCLLTDIELAKLGKEFIALEMYGEAHRCYNEALVKYPGEVTYHRRRGECNWKMNNLQDAIVDFESAVKKTPSSLRYRIDLIEVLCAADRCDEAEQYIIRSKSTEQLFEVSLQRMEIANEKKRLTRTLAHVRNLINVDADRQINWIKRESMIYELDEEAQHQVSVIETNRDSYLEWLARAFDHYTQKTSESALSTIPDEMPHYLTDSILFSDLIVDPFTTLTGISYDRSSIIPYIEDNGKDPITHQPLTESQLRPNLALKEASKLWRLQNC